MIQAIVQHKDIDFRSYLTDNVFTNKGCVYGFILKDKRCVITIQFVTPSQTTCHKTSPTTMDCSYLLPLKRIIK